MSDEQPQHNPTRRQKTRPAELLGLAAFFGIVTGAVVLMATRQWTISLVFAGVAFIITLLTFATLLISVGARMNQERVDPVDPDAPTGTAGSVHKDPFKG